MLLPDSASMTGNPEVILRSACKVVRGNFFRSDFVILTDRITGCR
jgi:hypothetical protein